jgi:ankyrin repeat protein
MAEGLAAEAAGELPELVEEEANPTARLLLTDVDMLCNYCEESPCFKKCWNCKVTKYCCKSCQCADWRAHRGKCRTPEERLKLNEMLYTACLEGKEGHVRMVNALIDRGADVNAPSTNPEHKKATPLMVASINGRVEVMRVLLAAGARVHLGDSDGRTALMHASYNGQVEAIRVLLAAGAQINQVDAIGGTALMAASAQGQVEAIRVLLAAGTQINHLDAHGQTAILAASAAGHVQAVKALLAAGADPRLVATNGATALSTAQRYKHPAVVSLLQAKLAELAGSA